MANVHQNKEFAEMLMPRYPLDEAVEWIAKNMPIEDVFDAPVVVKWVNETHDPQDVFTQSELEYWAELNGYTKTS